MQQKNIDETYKDVSSFLTREIKEKGLWGEFTKKADENKTILYQNFEETVREIIIDVEMEELAALKHRLFPNGSIQLNDLAKALRVNVLDQKKQKTLFLDSRASEVEQQQHIQNSQTNSLPQFAGSQQRVNSQRFVVPSQGSEINENQKTIFNQTQQSQPQQSGRDKQYFRQEQQQFTQDNNYQSFQSIKKPERQSGIFEAELNQFEQQQSLPQEQQQKQQSQQLLQSFAQQPQQSLQDQDQSIIKDAPQKHQQEEPKKQEPTLDQQIDDLFNTIDSNSNGWLDPKELNLALLQLGINPTQQELEEYFRQFDKNNDEKISKMEFNIIIKDQLMRAILSTDELFSLIQNEYNILTDANKNELDMPQLQQVFKKLGILLDNDDLRDLFDEIDEDGSGWIEQDELINYLDKPFSRHTPKSQNLLTKINNFKGLSITGIRELFQGIPKNFTYSFIFTQNKKGLNTISSCFSPKLDNSGLLYQDLNLIQAQKYNLTRSLIDTNQKEPLVFYEIKLHLAAGVPSPDDKKCDLKSFRLREVAMCLFDKVNQQFIGNTVFVPCTIDPSSPDKWLFLIDYPVILRCVPVKKDQQIALIIEFIAHMEKMGTLNSLSVSYGEILLTQIKKPGKQILLMNGTIITILGGSPFNSIVIDPQSIIQPKGLFKKQLTQPQLTIEFISIEMKKPQQIQLFNVLPETYMLPKNWIQLMHDFREYFAYRSVCQGSFDSSLPDYKMKSLLDLLDVPECGDAVTNWWNQNIKPKTFQDIINSVDLLCQRAYLATQRADFFLKAFPTVQRINHKYSIQEKRRSCLQDMFKDILTGLGNRQGGRKNENYFNMEPLILTTLIDDDKQTLDKILRRRKIK